MNEVIFQACSNIMLSDDEDVMVSFPEGWVHMRLDGTMGIYPQQIFIIAIYAGNQQTIKLQDGKSFKIHGSKDFCYDQPHSITVKHIKTEDNQGKTCVFLKGGPPADLL